MVAMHDSTTDQWTVAPAAEVSDSPSYELARLLFERAPPRRVAVLDDDRDSAQSIVDFLGAKGLDAQPFNCAIDLLAAMEGQPFDGFVVDWLLGDNTAKDLLSKIRARVPSGPVVILTGQIATGAASEDELVMVGASYRALLFEKPTVTTASAIVARVLQVIVLPFKVGALPVMPLHVSFCMGSKMTPTSSCLLARSRAAMDTQKCGMPKK